MKLRVSTAIGLQIVQDDDNAPLGLISGVLIHPDTGKVEGFAVSAGFFQMSEQLFLQSSDILSWGTSVRIRSADFIAPMDDIIRLQPLLDDPRTIIGQRVLVTDTNQYIGRCVDAQFDTRLFHIEWLFVRKWFVLSHPPIPVSSILEVRNDAIVIRDEEVMETEDETKTDPAVMPSPSVSVSNNKAL